MLIINCSADQNSNYFFSHSQGNFTVFDVEQQKAEIVVDSKESDKFFSASSYDFSHDKKFILTASSIIKVFRHSFLALWDVYNVETKQMTPVTIRGQAALCSLVKFSPVDHSMIVVYQNNIYYKKSPTDDEIQITTDGTKNISNGVPDWVNEEEIFSSNTALWLSPDAKKVAFIRFDDTKVPQMPLSVYGTIGDPSFQYPQHFPVSYPKVAAPNPQVKLIYADLSSIQSQVTLHEIPVPSRFVNNHLDHLITSVAWASSDVLVAVFMNRVQNKGEIMKCSTDATPVCEEVFKLDVEGGWVDFFHSPLFNEDGSSMTFIWSHEGYRHVTSINLKTKELKARTSGKFVVTEILAYNQKQNVVIFTANTEAESKVQHVYAIKNTDGAEKVCLTCTLLPGHNYFTAEVSKEGGSLAIIASGPDIPQVHVFTLKEEGKNITLTNRIEIEMNIPLKTILDGKKLPKIVYDKIKLDNGSESQVKMFLPADLDESSKYPMIVEVYGGPDSSSVTTKWGIEWGTYLTSAHNIIYVKIDGRGSGLRGDKNLFELYRRLGTVEVHDQIETAQKLQEKYSYIDAKHSAIWGWSYGGYVSGMSLATDKNDVYKCAVSVAPGKKISADQTKLV